MYTVTWRKPALDEFARIVDYTKIEWGQIQADKLVLLFEQATDSLVSSPKIGRRIRRKNAYVLVLSKIPFVMLYELLEEEIFINQIIHMSKRR